MTLRSPPFAGLALGVESQGATLTGELATSATEQDQYSYAYSYAVRPPGFTMIRATR
jgi:hypothetical protein